MKRSWGFAAACCFFAFRSAPALGQTPKPNHSSRVSKPVVSKVPPRPRLPPAPPLPFLPTLGSVRIVVERDVVIVTEDFVLPRSEETSADIYLYHAFGSPGLPRAVDAQIRAAHVPMRDEDGEKVSVTFESSLPPHAHLVAGEKQMAGFTLRLDAQGMRRAWSNGDFCILRIRTAIDALRDVPEREIVVRLGSTNGQPHAVGDIAFSARGIRVRDVEIRLCGPEAEPKPLYVHGVLPIRDAERIAPLFAVRHATDALCVRYASE